LIPLYEAYQALLSIYNRPRPADAHGPISDEQDRARAWGRLRWRTSAAPLVRPESDKKSIATDPTRAFSHPASASACLNAGLSGPD